MDGNQTTEAWQGRYRDHRGYEKMWVAEEVPLDWKEENLIKLQEKGDLSNCTNYKSRSWMFQGKCSIWPF